MNNDQPWATSSILQRKKFAHIIGRVEAYENNVFSSFQIQLTSDAACSDDSVERDTCDFFVATFIDDKVEVPPRESGNVLKIPSI